MAKSSFTFFFQEYCEKHNLTNEEIQERFAILQYQAEVERDTTQDHQQLSAIFAKWRENCPRKQANNDETTSQYTGAEHQAIRDLFASLKQSARESHSLHYQSHQGDAQAHAKDNQSRVLEVPAVTEVDKAVFAYLEAFFASDRSSSEILKLSNRLFNLGQAYNKTGK